METLVQRSENSFTELLERIAKGDRITHYRGRVPVAMLFPCNQR